MNRRNVSRLVLVCWLAFILCCTAIAQQPATGLPPFASFGGGPFDSVDLANLDVHFSVPVFGRAGRGIPFNYALGYDSLAWVPVNSSGASVWTPVNSNWGWRAVTEAATGYITYSDFNVSFLCPQGGPLGAAGKTVTQYFGFLYHDPTGALHPFPGTVTVTTISNSNCGTMGTTITPITNSITSDGSGYIVSTNTSSQLGPVTVKARGGITIITPPVGQSTGAGTITDANGNQISISSGGTITDTLGTPTAALTVTGTPSSGAVTYTYVAPNGNNASVAAHYGSYTVQTCFQVSGIAEFPATSEYLINNITLADGTSYQFTYETTLNCGATGSQVTGRVASVTLPSGGTISYTYGSNNSMMLDGGPSWLTRTLSGGTWTYVRGYQSGPSTPSQTNETITDPSGNNTTYNFSSIFETSQTVYTGSVGGTVLDSKKICYNGNFTSCSTATVNTSSYINRQDVYDSPGGGSQTSILTYLYDQYGNLTTEADKNYPGGSTVLRTVVVTPYTSLCTASKDICNLPQSVQVLDGSNTQRALTKYSYDGNGNTTQVSRWTSGSSYLNTGYSYNSNGTLHQVTDPNGTITAYTYNGACNSAFPTTVTVGSLSTQYAYNCNGGVVTSVTDPNGAVNSTSYTDPYYWRPHSSTDALNNTTTYTYTSTQFESVMPFNGGSSTTDVLVQLDSFGRKSVVQQREAPVENNAFDTVTYTYDDAGRLSFQSSPFKSVTPWGGSSLSGVTTMYDALGRPISAIDSNHGGTTWTYTLNDVLVSDSAQRQLEYDALGRVTSVCEINSLAGAGACPQNTAGTGFITTYSYDPLGNLLGVNQNSGGETRSFAFDGASRMTQEVNPESGTVAYTYDADSTCGSSSGDKVKRYDNAGNTTCYKWDGLHRLTQATYPSGPNTAGMPRKDFYYDSAPFWSISVNNVKGRLAEADTFLGSTTYTANAFSYDARGQMTDAYDFAQVGGWYHVQQSYAANGAPGTLQGFYSSGSAFSHTIGYDTTEGEGRPQGVYDTQRAGAIWAGTTYNPAGQPNGLSLVGSGEAFTYDPTTYHMTQWKSTVGSNTQTGIPTWNTNGTLGNLKVTDTYNPNNYQNCPYTYDALGRVASVTCTGGVGWGQGFTYDAYGNITKSGSLAFNPGYNNLISNNHANGFSYDGMGNVTNDGSYTYSYDAESRPINVSGIQITLDAFGRAVEQNNGGTYSEMVYSPSGQKFALMHGQSVQWYFVPLAAGATAVYNATDLQYYRHADWLGSSWLAVNTNGTVYGDQGYAPFGEGYAGSGSALGVFTGQTKDTVGGDYDFLFRQYAPGEGRWLVPDPAGLGAVDITNPQTWNRYAYVANNPLANKDPLGLYCAVGIACSQGGGSYDAFAGTGPGGVYAAGGGGGSGFAYGGQAGSDPCGGWCSPPSSLLGNITASQDAFGEQMYQQWEQQALLDLALQAAANQAATANCIATGLQSTFGASSVTAGTSTGEVGGHWNFNFQLSFSSYDAASAFTSVYQANMGGWQPPARFGSGPALHVENPASSWSVSSDGTYSLGVTTHLDIFNPNSGFGGLAGHVGYDGVWGHIVQFLGGNIDPKNCPYH